jgi:hypothetical protein
MGGRRGVAFYFGESEMKKGKGVAMAIGLGSPSPSDAIWYNPQEVPFAISGFAWFKRDCRYRRMPVKPEWKLPEAVDALADCTAGGQVRFQTNSKTVSLRAVLRGPANIPHMPATAQCGFDLYHGLPGRQRFCTVTKFDVARDAFSLALLSCKESAMRNITINFPLYQGVEEVAIGLDPGAQLVKSPPYAFGKPIVVYGTSITQGGCCSRPGMAYTNILSRKLNVEFINLGFSGSGRGEPEVARLISGIPDPGLFILDYEANSGDTIRQTLPTFIDIIRAARPQVPLLVLSCILFSAVALNKDVVKERRLRAHFQRDHVRLRRVAGDRNIFFHDGSSLLGKDFDECTVDGVHPTDLGHFRIADGLAPVLRRIMRKKAR